jgi:hypothetical protein
MKRKKGSEWKSVERVTRRKKKVSGVRVREEREGMSRRGGERGRRGGNEKRNFIFLFPVAVFRSYCTAHHPVHQ